MDATYLRCLSMLCLLAVPALVRADGPPPKLEATLRQLEKEIEAVRGLKFKAPVAAAVIARPGDAPKGVQGYYSPRDKKLFLYDDLKDSYRKGVLIHEMVHALQDQHFGLDRLHPTSFDGDADLARAALIEGDATFTMIEVLKKEQPKVEAMLEARLDRAKNLQNAFLYAEGARYVKALKDRGGWEAVNRAYRFPPRSTAAILKPEAGPMINLGPGKTRGAFEIIRLLHGHPAARAAAGALVNWCGDRVLESKEGSAWVVAFATTDAALRFEDALVRLWGATKGELEQLKNDPRDSRWRGGKGVVLGVERRWERVYALEAADEKAYRALLDKVEGPLSLTVLSARDKKQITFGEMLDRLLEADLVCVGESHDSDLDHRVQFQLIKGLFARDERLGVGMEMFQRPFQQHLDRYRPEDLDEERFLQATQYRQRWGYAWGMYRPLFEFCRRNGVPVAALNAPRELTQRVSKVGYAGLTEKEKGELGKIDFHVKEHRDYWYERLARMHGKAKVTEEQKERSYQLMTVWDEYMADSAARFQRERGVRRLVVLAGSGHVERGFGIPLRAARRTGGRAVTVGVAVGADPAKAAAGLVVDYLVIVR